MCRAPGRRRGGARQLAARQPPSRASRPPGGGSPRHRDAPHSTTRSSGPRPNQLDFGSRLAGRAPPVGHPALLAPPPLLRNARVRTRRTPDSVGPVACLRASVRRRTEVDPCRPLPPESSTPDAGLIARSRPGRSGSLLTLLGLVCLLAVPLGAPASVAGASVSDQIEAARERQHELGRSIARQDSIIAALDRDQASTQAAIEDTRTSSPSTSTRPSSNSASSRPSSASPASAPASTSSSTSCARATGRWTC